MEHNTLIENIQDSTTLWASGYVKFWFGTIIHQHYPGAHKAILCQSPPLMKWPTIDHFTWSLDSNKVYWTPNCCIWYQYTLFIYLKCANANSTNVVRFPFSRNTGLQSWKTREWFTAFQESIQTRWYSLIKKNTLTSA